MTEQKSLDLGAGPSAPGRLHDLWAHSPAWGWRVPLTVGDNRRGLMEVAADHGFNVLGPGGTGVQRERNVAGFSVPSAIEATRVRSMVDMRETLKHLTLGTPLANC